MRHFLIVFSLCLIAPFLLAQEETRIITTDTSVIKIKLYRYTNPQTNEFVYTGKTVYERFKGKNLVHEVSYYEDTITVESDGYWDTTLHNSVGIRRTYDKNGNLKLTINYDNRSWVPADTSQYPYYRLLNHMKEQGDSIMKAIYSPAFFNEHLKWNIGSSYYYDKTYSYPCFPVNWLRDDSKRYKPTEFLICYDIHIDGRIFEDAIKILFDVKGKILVSHCWNTSSTVYNYGLEDLQDKSTRNFNLTTEQAIQLSRQFGLQETDSTKAISSLRWESAKDATPQIFNGHWRIYVLQKTRSEITEHPDYNKKRHPAKDGYYTFVQHYDIWVFNPWTGEFIEKKSMHQDYHTEPGMLYFRAQLIDDSERKPTNNTRAKKKRG